MFSSVLLSLSSHSAFCPIFESQQTCLCLHLSLLLVGSTASSIKSALFCVLLLCTFLFSSLTVCLDPLKDEKLQWAMKHLQGFNWTATFTTEGCSIAQAHALVEAARVGVQDMLSYAAKYKVDNNADWNRFFMNDGEADWGYGWTTRGDVSSDYMAWRWRWWPMYLY
jgi:hypothetical protein